MGLSPSPRRFSDRFLGQGNALDSRTATPPFSPVRGDTDARTALGVTGTSRIVPPLQGFDILTADKKTRTLSWAGMFNAFGVFRLRLGAICEHSQNVGQAGDRNSSAPVKKA
jgi:hypothetical protein